MAFVYNIMSRSLKALFVPIGDVGHINTCIGAAQPLIRAGHAVAFLVDSYWEGKLREFGIEECILNTQTTAHTENVVKNVAISLLNSGEVGPNTSIQKVSGNYQSVLLDKIIARDEHLVTLLPNLKPDVIFGELYRPIPAIELSGIPCVLISVVNPAAIFDYRHIYLLEDSVLECKNDKPHKKDFLVTL
ncbi:unnamed protein product [Medioppia subpectinata]|uniref:Uncharacterized protein n=1 Tax=Medioppia subpectinata TaxID=1979941 RepID=A0A7R9KPH9_9ACAR|nr:unnamed protein product [Medioppia subpectinata]CAG2107401.1 unnamed protein product [Medioppia subpectinata]